MTKSCKIYDFTFILHFRAHAVHIYFTFVSKPRFPVYAKLLSAQPTTKHDVLKGVAIPFKNSCFVFFEGDSYPLQKFMLYRVSRAHASCVCRDQDQAQA